MENFTNNPINMESLPKFEEVELLQVSQKYLVKMSIGTGIFMLVCFVALSVAYVVFPEFFQKYLPYFIVFLVIYFAWSFFSNFKSYKKMGYGLRERDIVFRHGFIFERTTVVPYNRIQHVSGNRGILDKLLGLSTVNIYTAGGSGSDLTIPGLLLDTAEPLKEAISERMSGHV